ncbi:WXG100 family type VII secretion target [Paenibacillus xylanexedens]|uniref:WXG100 family type VII secretion target n=1 Tax=Paenibacillus xylanexedens TaxID=528191 RepID=UPI0011A3EA6D|nr:WXG100 family type VII secretion target [Paenibacillus xylanexedens]
MNRFGGDNGMLRIQVHPDELDAKARYVQQCKLDLDRMVRELDKSLNMLQSEWSGVTQEKFFWDFMEVKHVFPSTLGMLDNIQKEFTFIANNFRTTDSTGEVALYIPNELKPSFFTGAVDKAIGDTVTGLGETAEALIYNPLSTLGSLAYAMTLGKVVDAGRGLAFAWDAAWGNGTARSDIEQFVDEKKKQLDEDESGYVKGAMVGQALSYFIFGKALHSKDQHGSGGGGAKKEAWKSNLKGNYSMNNLIEPSMPKGGKPKGNYANNEGGRGNVRQNESANLLADQGYDIEMLDEVVGGNGFGIKKGKNPDFIIEGKIFDCYSPDSNTPIDSISAKIKNKTKSQAQRIVLNLDDYPSAKIDELLETLLRQTNPQANLKHLDELVVIRDGVINKVFGR